MSRKIVILDDEGGDWVGLYINNKLMLEGHDLHFRDIFDALKEEWEWHEIEIESSLPDELPIEFR